VGQYARIARVSFSIGAAKRADKPRPVPATGAESAARAVTRQPFMRANSRFEWNPDSPSEWPQEADRGQSALPVTAAKRRREMILRVPKPGRWRYAYLLIALVVLLLAYPYLGTGGPLGVAALLIPIAAVNALATHQRHRAVPMVLAIVTLAGIAQEAAGVEALPKLVPLGSALLLFAYTTVFVLVRVLRSERVTGDTLCGAVAGRAGGPLRNHLHRHPGGPPDRAAPRCARFPARRPRGGTRLRISRPVPRRSRRRRTGRASSTSGTR
jgi:hypothetical protein